MIYIYIYPYIYSFLHICKYMLAGYHSNILFEVYVKCRAVDPLQKMTMLTTFGSFEQLCCAVSHTMSRTMAE